jgi:hypothetical protein
VALGALAARVVEDPSIMSRLPFVPSAAEFGDAGPERPAGG